MTNVDIGVTCRAKSESAAMDFFSLGALSNGIRIHVSRDLRRPPVLRERGAGWINLTNVEWNRTAWEDAACCYHMKAQPGLFGTPEMIVVPEWLWPQLQRALATSGINAAVTLPIANRRPAPKNARERRQRRIENRKRRRA